MPQLDKLSFVTQIFWLSLFFFSLYFLSINFFTTLIYKNLKLYNILNKNCKNFTLIHNGNNYFNIYIPYINLTYFFFTKIFKVFTQKKYHKTSFVITNANFIFEDLQDSLYFSDISDIITINNKNYEI